MFTTFDEDFLKQYKHKQPNWGFNGLGYIVYKRSYARPIYDEAGKLVRTESWWETIRRCIEGAQKIGACYTKAEAERLFDAMFHLKCSYAGRMLWQLGTPMVDRFQANSLINCFYIAITKPEDFCFLFENLMLGAGVGFSVRREHIHELPKVKCGVNIIHELTKDAIFVVPDSRLGWVELLRKVMHSFFVSGKGFSYSTILVRGYGEPIKTFGGTASGPKILIDGITKVCEIFKTREGKKLRSVDVLDICNIIGSIVVAGNVRRSSQIALGDADDYLFLRAKRWDVGTIPNWRAMSNNTIVADDFSYLGDAFWSGYDGNGEPYGLFNLNLSQTYGRLIDGPMKDCALYPMDIDPATGGNPCNEISLCSAESCNLSDLYLNNINSLEELIDYAKLLYKTQKSVASLNYLHEETNHVVHKHFRLGLGVTGICQSLDKLDWLDKCYKELRKFDKERSKQKNQPESIKLTTVKPSGCRPWWSLVTTDHGIFTLEELFTDHPESDKWSKFHLGYEVLQGAAKNPISKTYYNGKSEIIKIGMSYNISVESTKNHPWFVLQHYYPQKKSNGRFQNINKWIQAKDLTIGDIIDINLRSYEQKNEATLQKVNSRSIKMRHDCDNIQQPISMSPDLAWLLGYLWGDGSQSPGHYKVSFSDARLDNLQKAKTIIESIFGLRDQRLIKEYGRKNSHVFTIHSKMLWHWLIKNNVWKYFTDELDIIPKCVRMSSQESIIAFISGLIDADGSVDHKRWNISLSSSYDLFTKNVQDVALSVGLVFGRWKQKERKKETVRFRNDLYLSSGTLSSSFGMLKKHSNKIKQSDSARGGATWSHFRSKKNRILGKVEQIEMKPEEETYDIEVENEPWFYAGAVKSHNTLSLLSGATPGVHPAYSPYYIRRVRMASNDPLIKLCKDHGYNTEYVLNFDGTENRGTVIVEFPCRGGEGAVFTKDMTAVAQLELVKKLQTVWSDNAVSCTVYYKPEELEGIKKWMKENYETSLKTVSFLRYQAHNFKQAPYEEITEEKYKELIKKIKHFSKDDVNVGNGEFADSLECSKGACPIK